MTSYVVSAPRSGMNWLRFCVETYYGVSTPGKTALRKAVPGETPPFIRSHDALNRSRWPKRQRTGAWQLIDPSATQSDRIALILRDPLETFVRAFDRRFWYFSCYPGNIRFLSQCRGKTSVFYYEDLVARPEAMFDLLEFLQISPARGFSGPSLAELTNCWGDLGARSRDLYDTNQAVGGGSQTRNRPTDFQFHQRNLDEWEKDRVWRYLRYQLTTQEFRLLERYNPRETGSPRVVEKLRYLY